MNITSLTVFIPLAALGQLPRPNHPLARTLTFTFDRTMFQSVSFD